MLAAASGFGQEAANPPIDAARKQAVIDDIVRQFNRSYVRARTAVSTQSIWLRVIGSDARPRTFSSAISYALSKAPAAGTATSGATPVPSQFVFDTGLIEPAASKRTP